MSHAVGTGQACVRKVIGTIYLQEADGGAEMLDTYTKLDINTRFTVMSFLIELHRKCSGNTRRNSLLKLKKKKKLLQEKPLELVLADRGPPDRKNCQHGDCTHSKNIGVGKYISPGRIVFKWEGGWNLRSEGRMGVVGCHKK